MTIKEFFDKKIDWKFFNYLQYVSTQFEDKGYEIVLSIAIARGRKDYNSHVYDDIYEIDSSDAGRFIEEVSNKEKIFDYYKHNGLFYLVSIRKESRLDDECVEDFWAYVSDKCIRYSQAITRILVLKPQ